MSYVHVHIPPTSPAEPRTLFLFHGTGGDEHDLIELGQAVLPGARIISLRGDVREGASNRFFRRFAEGVFDLDDVRRAADKVAEFVASCAVEYGFDAYQAIALGYSNGANVIGAAMMRHPGVFGEAVLLRAMRTLPPAPEARFPARVLITSGERDPIVPLHDASELANEFRSMGSTVQHAVFATSHGLTQADFLHACEFLGGPVPTGK